MPEPMNVLDTLILISNHVYSYFLSTGDLVLVQSNMILSFLYLQFNIDEYIPICNATFLFYHFSLMLGFYVSKFHLTKDDTAHNFPVPGFIHGFQVQYLYK
jgi:hypothetical protein